MKFSTQALLLASYACILVSIVHGAKNGEKSTKLDVSGARAKIDIVDKTQGKTDLSFEIDGKSEFFQGLMEFKSKSKFGKESDFSKVSERNEIRFRLREIIEYDDVDGDGAFTSADDKKGSYPVDGKWKWKNIDHVTVESVEVFTLTTIDDKVTVIGRYSPDVVNETLSADQMKIDILVDGYPYVTTGTKLAFHSDVKSKNKVKSQVSNGEEGMKTEVESSVIQGALTWVPSVTADGQEVDIVASEGPSDSNGPEVYFTINTSAQINSLIWDPALVAQEASDNTLIIVCSVGGAVLVLGAAFLIMKKRGGKASGNAQIASNV